MAKIDELFRMMAEQGASDLHLISGQPPALRIDGELERIAGQAVLTQDTLQPLLHAKISHFQLAMGHLKMKPNPPINQHLSIIIPG